MKDQACDKTKANLPLRKLLLLVCCLLLSALVAISTDVRHSAASYAGEADLSVDQSLPADEVLPGEELTLTITVANAGPDEATKVKLRAELEGMSPVSSPTPSQGTCSVVEMLIACELGKIDVDKEVAVSVLAQVDAALTGGQTITSTAVVFAEEDDPTSPNVNIITATVLAKADLALEKSASPSVISTGEVLNYTLKISNIGALSAEAVKLTDELPGELLDPEYSQDGGTTWKAWSGSLELGSLPPGGTSTVLIRSTLGSTNDSSLVNTASVTTTTAEAVLDNNTDSVTVTVSKNADLALSMTAAPNPVLVGRSLTYSLAVTNLGPEDASGVTIIDTLPSGVTYVSASLAGGSCELKLGVVTCALASLDAQETAEAQIIVLPTVEGTLLNRAVVTADQDDPDEDNNEDSISVTVKKYSLWLPYVARDTVLRSKLLSDPFNTDLGWVLEPSYTGLAGINNGEYYLRSTASGQIVNSIAPVSYLPSIFSIEAEARRTLGSDTRFGIVFNFLDINNFYVFFVNPATSSYSLYRLQNGWTTLVSWTPDASIHAGTAINLLKVERAGGQISLYANGDLLKKVDDGAIKGGQAGLQLWGGNDLVAEARFDNVAIWAYPDDFAENLGWVLDPASVGAAGILDGEYYLRTTATGQIVNSVAPDGELPAQFTAQVEAHRTQGIDTRYGLVFNWKDLNNFYVFYINPASQEFCLYKYQAGWTTLIPWTKTPSIKVGNAINAMKVLRDGTQISVYVNNALLGTVSNSAIYGGRAGLQVWGSALDPVAEARFDKFWVLP